MNCGFSPLRIFVLCFCFLVGKMSSLTCECVLALPFDGTPRACRTWTVILRMGASYWREISRLACGNGLNSMSDLRDFRSLVSKRGSCSWTSTMHWGENWWNDVKVNLVNIQSSAQCSHLAHCSYREHRLGCLAASRQVEFAHYHYCVARIDSMWIFRVSN